MHGVDTLLDVGILRVHTPVGPLDQGFLELQTWLIWVCGIICLSPRVSPCASETGDMTCRGTVVYVCVYPGLLVFIRI
jgi:uncharacterized membrane protein YecN with MAPEG domain